MIDASVSGRIHGQPAQRTGKNGQPFTVAKVRVPLPAHKMVIPPSWQKQAVSPAPTPEGEQVEVTL